MKTPLVSVIIAVFNREAYIGQAIRSVLEQRYNKFELIVVDDGSTDNTPEIVRSFTDPRLRFIEKPHTRCWDTKNHGLRAAQGEWVMYLDSDDFLGPDYLEEGIKGMKNRPDGDWYYPTKLVITEKDGVPTHRIWRYVDYPDDQRQRLLNLFLTTTINGIPHTGAFVRRSLFDQLGEFDGSLYNIGDIAYTVKHALQIRYRLLKQLYPYFKRHHETQVCLNMHYRIKTTADLMRWAMDHYPPAMLHPDFADGDPNPLRLLDFFIECFMGQALKVPDEHKEPFMIHARELLSKRREMELERET